MLEVFQEGVEGDGDDLGLLLGPSLGVDALQLFGLEDGPAQFVGAEAPVRLEQLAQNSPCGDRTKRSPRIAAAAVRRTHLAGSVPRWWR